MPDLCKAGLWDIQPDATCPVCGALPDGKCKWSAKPLTGDVLERSEIVGIIGEAIMDGYHDHPPFPSMPSDVAWMVAREIAMRLESHGVVLRYAK